MITGYRTRSRTMDYLQTTLRLLLLLLLQQQIASAIDLCEYLTQLFFCVCLIITSVIHRYTEGIVLHFCFFFLRSRRIVYLS